MKTYLFLMVASAWVVAAFAVEPSPTPTALEKLREQVAVQDKVMHKIMCKQYPSKCATATPTPH